MHNQAYTAKHNFYVFCKSASFEDAKNFNVTEYVCW